MRRPTVRGSVLLMVVVGVMSLTGRATAQGSVERGAYLVGIMGCNDCHTPLGPDGRPMTQFALAGHPPEAPVAVYQGGPLGSFALTNTSWAGPWGVSFARNLTPDPDTGLGKWTEADLKAMWAYLQSLTPIKNAVPDNVPPAAPPGK